MSPLDAASALLDALLTRCAEKVRLVGRAHRLDPFEVDEVFQEVRVRIWSAVGSGERLAQLPASYVYQTARSVALDLIRRGNARRTGVTGPIAEARDQPAPGPGAAERLDQTELGERIAEALGDLSASRRSVVRMYLEGYSADEIGALLQWTEPKTRNLLYRGLADLREALARRGVGPEGLQ